MGIIPSFLMASAGHNVQLGRSGDANTAHKMPKNQSWDRLTDGPTNKTYTVNKNNVAHD